MSASSSTSTTPARFVTGSTMRHVLVMSATGSAGLMAIFAVDLLSLLYISWLGDPTLTAAVGFATVILFFGTSINVGLMIAITALTAKAIGAGERERACRLATSGLVIACAIAFALSLLILPLLPLLLRLLGASEEVFPHALTFLWIVLPANALMMLGMGFSGLLRALGDANRAMMVTLIGGILTAVLDPLFIFVFKLDLVGAAIAMVISRTVFALVGWHGVVRVHRLIARPDLASLRLDGRAVLGIAAPAVLTNIATPVSGAFLAGVIARFGETAIAGGAVIDRIIPVAFGGLFALSGAIGPILGQNWGARRYDRMRRSLRDSVLLAFVYVMTIWGILFLSREAIVRSFGAVGLGAELILFFCLISGLSWFFNGLLFVANASFNNLGFPLLSTAFNWGRATLGTIPFAILGAQWGGLTGILTGVTLGSLIFGLSAILTAFWTIKRLENRDNPAL
jgi:putative MATE family efflux protein